MQRPFRRGVCFLKRQNAVINHETRPQLESKLEVFFPFRYMVFHHLVRVSLFECIPPSSHSVSHTHVFRAQRRGDNIIEGHYAERTFAALLSPPLTEEQTRTIFAMRTSKIVGCSGYCGMLLGVSRTSQINY